MTHSSIHYANMLNVLLGCKCLVFRRMVVVLLLVFSPNLLANNNSVNMKNISFTIPKQRADLALTLFAEQANLTLVFPFDEVKKVKANRLVGEYSLEDAINILLAKTGLVTSLDSNLVLTIATNKSLGLKRDKMINNKNKKGLITLFASMFVASGTVAQEAEGEPTSKKHEIEQITVTARKISENLQETPISITAFSSEGLERRQINGTNDLGKITPNLEFTNNAPLAGNNSSSQVFIRGIGQVDPTAGVDPGVGLYIDDVYMGQSVGGSMELRDIYGVQILRGPQGTLFGRNTIGGAVLINSTPPGDEFKGTVKVGLGTDNLQEIFAAVDVPIAEDLLTRFTYGSKKQDGYVKRVSDGTDLGDTNNYIITAKAVYTPSEALTVKLNFDYAEADENGSPLVFAESNNNATFQKVASADAGCPGFEGGWFTQAVPENNDPRCANNQWNAGEFKNNGTAELESKLENWGLSLNVAYDVNTHITLKSISAYRELAWTGIRDADNTPFTILHTDYDSEGDQFSQEFQLLYSDEKLNGVFGLYYYTEQYQDILDVYLNTPAPGPQKQSDNNEIDNESWAAFAQVTYDLTDKLSGTFGIRHTEETKRSLPDQFDYSDPDTKLLPAIWYEADFSATNISLNLSYMLGDSTMVYGSYSEGYKGGGFNSHFNNAQSTEDLANFHKFDEEEAETWEIGLKTDFLDNTLRVNGSIFTTDYTNLQFVFRVGPAPYLLNAGSASIDGAEIEITWLPTDNWIIEAGLGYLDDSIDEISTDFGSLGSDGPVTGITTANTLPYTPEIKANLGIGYTLELSEWIITPRADISYRDETFFDTNNTVEIAQNDSVTTIDAVIGFESVEMDLKLMVGVSNLTDELYPIAGNSSLSTGSGYAEIAYAREREYFISVTYDFY